MDTIIIDGGHNFQNSFDRLQKEASNLDFASSMGESNRLC